MGKSNSFPHVQIALVLWLTICFLQPRGSDGCKKPEREALLKLRSQMTTHDVASRVPLWEGEDCCQWRGVRCDNNTGLVIKLNFYQSVPDRVKRFNASEVLSPLLELKALTHLDLSGSNFYGHSMPKLMGSLRHLRYLDLSSTGFGGFIPHELGNLTELVELDLSYNYMRATRLDWALGLLKLQYLDLSFNNLGTTLPPFLEKLDSLQVLDLSFNAFNCSIPRWLGNLKGLYYLDLSYNTFSHIDEGIWSIIGNLCQLKHLDLSGVGIVEELANPPVNFSKCTTYELELLDLNSNNITGDVATLKLHQFPNLFFLSLFDNNLRGTFGEGDIGNLSKLSLVYIGGNHDLVVNLTSDWIPPFHLLQLNLASTRIINPPRWLSSQSKLTWLFLYDTGISGDVQDWLRNLTSLVHADLAGNFLSGPLPKQSYEELEYFDIGFNNISGPISNMLGQNCSLQYLQLRNNSLEGYIPSSLGYCVNLVYLDLSFNRIMGNVPPFVTDSLTNLKVLQLGGNKLGGVTQNSTLLVPNDSTVGTIPSALCKLTSLEYLDLQENMFSGRIPDCWRASDLSLLSLSANKLSGPIPCSLLKEGLLFLHLNDNMLSGHIPSCSNGLHRLRILDVGGNKLSGEIPKWLNKRKSSALEVLRLQGNMFDGTIPHPLCFIPHLRVVDLSRNQFTGKIPLCFGNLTGINSHYIEEKIILGAPNGSYQNFTFGGRGVSEVVAGTLRSYEKTLPYLTAIDLSSNYLVGPIPGELTKLSELLVLNLSHNHLTGDIPKKIGNMSSLETLDLSMNLLCGTIPPSIGDINFLNYLNLSHNNLSGEIPTSRHLQTFDDPSIYAGNAGLCGDPLPKKCSSHEEQPKGPGGDVKNNEDKLEKMWFCLLVMSGFATGFWGIVGALLLNRRGRHAFFRILEDIYDWLYVAVALKKAKLKTILKRGY